MRFIDDMIRGYVLMSMYQNVRQKRQQRKRMKNQRLIQQHQLSSSQQQTVQYMELVRKSKSVWVALLLSFIWPVGLFYASWKVGLAFIGFIVIHDKLGLHLISDMVSLIGLSVIITFSTVVYKNIKIENQIRAIHEERKGEVDGRSHFRRNTVR